MTGWIGISLGDVTGVGPEVALKAVAAEAETDETRYLFIGDEGCLSRMREALRLPMQWQKFTGTGQSGRFFFHAPSAAALPAGLPKGSPLAARAALDNLRAGAEFCSRGGVDALITAPVNKEAIIRTGERFVGQTEFLSELAGTDRTAMMLLGEDELHRWLRVALVTTHLPLRLVAEHITQPKVELAIELAVSACRDLGLPRARIGVCGLNPHAGEGGKLGDEEITVITPAVEAQRRRGVDAIGPVAADTLFYYAFKGDYDAVVAMYHDQGLAPLKMIGFETGVNWTLGLPFIRTSPDHGTAYDIAGKGVANPASMQSAIRLAKRLARQRGPK